MKKHFTLKTLFVIFSTVFILSCSNDESSTSTNDSNNNCGKIEVQNYYVQPTSIQLQFLKGNNANSTKIEYGITGFIPGTGTSVITSDDYFYFENLNTSTTYDFYLTGICSTTEQSVVTKLGSITTNPGSCNGTASVSIHQSSTTYVSLDFSYNDSSPSYYEVEYGLAGFALGTGTRVDTSSQFSSNYIDISNIQSNTAYDFYVRAICNSSAPNDASNFVKYSYTTIGDCPKPANLSSYVYSGSCNTGSGATRVMSWSYDYTPTPTSFTVCIVEQGNLPDANANSFTTSQNAIAISGMFCLWKAFYVRANCQNGQNSQWAGPYYF